MSKKTVNNINMDRVRDLLKSSTVDKNGGCFVMKLKGEVAIFIEEAKKAKEAGADIKYARVSAVLREVYDLDISGGSVTNHLKGLCKCAKIAKATLAMKKK